MWSFPKRDWHTIYSLILTFLVQILAAVMITEWSLAYGFLLILKMLQLSLRSGGSLFQEVERVIVYRSHFHRCRNSDIVKGEEFPHNLLVGELQPKPHLLPLYPVTFLWPAELIDHHDLLGIWLKLTNKSEQWWKKSLQMTHLLTSHRLMSSQCSSTRSHLNIQLWSSVLVFKLHLFF